MLNPSYVVGLSQQSMVWEQLLTNISNSNSSSSDCPDGNQAIWNTFQQCITTPLDWVSFAVGMASIVFWLGVLLPQIVENFKDMNGVSSISAGLLFSWIFGDTTNLVGAFLTKQGLIQVLLGVWFVMTDLILSSQLIYYHCVFKRRQQRELSGQSTVPKASQRLVLCIMGIFCTSAMLSGLSGPMALQPMSRSGHGHGRQLLSTDLQEDQPFLQTTQEIIGYSLGIISTVAYFMSRSFQIYKNVTQKNVKGLSTMTFVMAVMGNLLYGLAIVLYSVAPHYTLLHLPWLLGSWGIMFMDCFIVFQIKRYSKEETVTLLVVPDMDDEVSPLMNSINSQEDQYGALQADRVVV